MLGFGACYAIGGGSIGALGFYHVSQAAAARAAEPKRRSRAIARLTMLGALSSPIFLPLTAWLVQAMTRRTTVLFDAAAVALAFLAAAALVPDHGTARPLRVAQRSCTLGEAVRSAGSSSPRCSVASRPT